MNFLKSVPKLYRPSLQNIQAFSFGSNKVSQNSAQEKENKAQKQDENKGKTPADDYAKTGKVVNKKAAFEQNVGASPKDSNKK